MSSASRSCPANHKHYKHCVFLPNTSCWTACAQVRAVLPHALPLRSEPYTLTLFMPACAPAPAQTAGAAAAAPAPDGTRSAGPAARPDRDRDGPAGGSGGVPSLEDQQAEGAPGRAAAKSLGLYTRGGGYFLVPADDAAAADAGELQRRAQVLAAGLLHPADPGNPAKHEAAGAHVAPGAAPAQPSKQRAPAHAAAQIAPGTGSAEQPSTPPAAGAKGARPGREPRRPPQRALSASPLRSRKGAPRRSGGGGPADPDCGRLGGRDARPLRDRAHKLQAWFGAGVFALLEPGSFSRVCLDEQARHAGQ